jgi:hypothetical protein
MQLRGKVLAIKEVQVISDKFKKQEVILKQEGVEYDSDVPIEFIQDKGIELVRGLKVGSSYDIDINISVREWNDRHYVSLKAWKVNSLDGGEQETPGEQVQAPTSSIKDDDMPF